MSFCLGGQRVGGAHGLQGEMLGSTQPTALLEENAGQGLICKLRVVAVSCVRACLIPWGSRMGRGGTGHGRPPRGQHLAFTRHSLPVPHPSCADPPPATPTLTPSCQDTLRTLAWAPAHPHIPQDPAVLFRLFPWRLCLTPPSWTR